jgi:hypothetical protein
MSKPLIRWTIGGGLCSIQSFICLRRSVKKMNEIYDKDLDYTICYNNLDFNQFKFIQSLDVPLIDQSLYVDTLSVPPAYCAWKFYPPRLRPESHEVFIDNDIIWHKRSPSLDAFLRSTTKLLCCQGWSPFGLYGQYPNILRDAMNAGMVGVPPKFDLAKAINQKLLGPWSSHFDDQGIFALIVAENPNIRIPLSELLIGDDFEADRCGWHFAGMNQRNSRMWEMYKNLGMLL